MKAQVEVQHVERNTTGVGSPLPYYKPGRVIYIYGKAPSTGIAEFDLYPQNYEGINLRLTIDAENYHVLRNSYVHDKWLTAETEGYSGILPGRFFSITIICQMYGFEIAVNGYHFATYYHRIPFYKNMWIGLNHDIYVTPFEYY